jgi:hypothetical protein
MIASDHDCPTTILPIQNGEVAFLAVVMSCNAIPGFSSAVKGYLLGLKHRKESSK